MVTVVPSRDVGAVLPLKSEAAQDRVSTARFEPYISTHVPGAAAGNAPKPPALTKPVTTGDRFVCTLGRLQELSIVSTGVLKRNCVAPLGFPKVSPTMKLFDE